MRPSTRLATAALAALACVAAPPRCDRAVNAQEKPAARLPSLTAASGGRFSRSTARAITQGVERRRRLDAAAPPSGGRASVQHAVQVGLFQRPASTS